MSPVEVEGALDERGVLAAITADCTIVLNGACSALTSEATNSGDSCTIGDNVAADVDVVVEEFDETIGNELSRLFLEDRGIFFFFKRRQDSTKTHQINADYVKILREDYDVTCLS